MIASVHPRTLLVLPRRAWRVFRSRSVQPEVREKRAANRSLFGSFEEMLSHPVRLMIRDFDA
jgi:hypothetical protein